MAALVYYRKWRSRTFAEVVGQPHVTRTLLSALAQNRVAHAYLFAGPRGTGKTSTARILAKAVNCLNNGRGEPCNQCPMCLAITEGRALDLIEIDAASNRGIDEIRSLREKVNFSPNEARYKVYIVDEVHMLTTEAFNALLKTLEEPPQHIIFVLATTEAHRVPATILSRCQRFDFHRITLEDIVYRLQQICDAEGISVALAALQLIAKSAQGSLRDAENLLEELAITYSGDIEAEQARSLLGLIGDGRPLELAKQIVGRDSSGGLHTIEGAVNDGLDLRQFHRETLEWLRAMMLLKSGARADIYLSAEVAAELSQVIDNVTLPRLVEVVKTFSQADLRYSDASSLALELATLECAVEPTAPVSAHQAAVAPAATSQAIILEPKTPDPPPTSATHLYSAPKASTSPPEPSPAPPSDPATAEPDPQNIDHSSPARVLEMLKAHWPRVLRLARQEDKYVEAVLRSQSQCQLVSVEGDTITFSIQSAKIMDQMWDPQKHRVAESVLGRALGKAYKVRYVTPSRGNDPVVDYLLSVGAKLVGQDREA